MLNIGGPCTYVRVSASADAVYLVRRKEEMEVQGRSDPHNLVAGGLVEVMEAAAWLSVSRSTVYSLMESGELPYVKIGASRRVPKQALIELSARHLCGYAAAVS